VIATMPAGVARLSRSLALAAFFVIASEDAAAQRSTSQRLDPQTRFIVQPIIDSAAARGLPTGPLVSKALEGAAKHADRARIVSAVHSLSRDLSVARDALGADADEDGLVAGVAALRAGVSPSYLRQIRATRAAPAVAWPLVVLADLVSRGVPVDTAAHVVLVLARAGAADNAYAGLREQLRQGSEVRSVSSGVPTAAPPIAPRESHPLAPAARPQGARP
jgi:hypothetical protein